GIWIKAEHDQNEYIFSRVESSDAQGEQVQPQTPGVAMKGGANEPGHQKTQTQAVNGDEDKIRGKELHVQSPARFAVMAESGEGLLGCEVKPQVQEPVVAAQLHKRAIGDRQR